MAILLLKAESVNVSDLERAFEAGAEVNPKVLVEKKLVNRTSGKTPAVKILGNGEITKKLSIKACYVSKSALEKLNKAGCTVEALEKTVKKSKKKKAAKGKGGAASAKTDKTDKPAEKKEKAAPAPAKAETKKAETKKEAK